MRIPSYDDLTPSIPDVSVRDTFAHVRHILPLDAAPAGPHAPVATGMPTTRLFACLRATDMAAAARLQGPMLAIARDFSPRIERHGACVVMDVSGLGQLLGDARAIAGELDRAADRAAAGPGDAIRVAIAP